MDEPRVRGGVVESYQQLSAGLMSGLAHLGLAVRADKEYSPSEVGTVKGPVCFEVPSNYEITVGSGGQQLHLIVHTDPTFRTGKKLAPRDVHFAVRAPSFREAVAYFKAKGYREDATDEFSRMIVRPHATAGFPQLYILDPDRHIIEVNSAVLD